MKRKVALSLFLACAIAGQMQVALAAVDLQVGFGEEILTLGSQDSMESENSFSSQTMARAGTRITSRPNLWNYVKTFGFDYDTTALLDPVESAWIAQHHDMVVTGNVSNETIYDNLKAANPDVILIGYVAYNTVFESPGAMMVTWLTNWLATNQPGADPEELFYHYATDTTVQLRNGSLQTFKGFGGPGGTAASLADARVPSAWHPTQFNICPTSQVFRDAFTAFMLDQLTVNAAQNKYLDGIMLDTFDGTVDYYFDLQLHNTIEMQALGKSTDADAREQARGDLLELRNDMEQYISSVVGKDIRLIPNAGDVDYVFKSPRSLVFADAFDSIYDEMCIEYLISSGGTAYFRIERLQQTYDSMEAGNVYIINSQTNWPTRFGDTSSPADDVPEDAWNDFVQHIIASHYLIAHPNGFYSIHKGSAARYAGVNGSIRETHWDINMEYDLGNPVVRAGEDYWGVFGTDRFFVLDSLNRFDKILAREYDNALVVAKFAGNGWANIGINPTTHDLGGEYRRLLPDNSLGPVITSITLGSGGGAILIKASLAPVTPTPTATPAITPTPTPSPSGDASGGTSDGNTGLFPAFVIGYGGQATPTPSDGDSSDMIETVQVTDGVTEMPVTAASTTAVVLGVIGLGSVVAIIYRRKSIKRNR